MTTCPTCPTHSSVESYPPAWIRIAWWTPRAPGSFAPSFRRYDEAPMASVDNLYDPSDIDEFLLDRVQAAPHIGMLGQSAREITSRVSGGLDTWVSRLTISPHRQHIKGTASTSREQPVPGKPSCRCRSWARRPIMDSKRCTFATTAPWSMPSIPWPRLP